MRKSCRDGGAVTQRVVGRAAALLAVPLLALGLTGCASVAIGPQAVRQQVIEQTGQPPVSEVEVDVGRIAMAIVRATVPGSVQPLPLAGLRRLEIASYGLGGPGAAPLDLSALPTVRWDPVVRQRDAAHSVLVLARPLRRERPIRDLVLVASGRGQVVYARLAGDLSRELPAALAEAAAGGDPEAVRRALVESASGGRTGN